MFVEGKSRVVDVFKYCFVSSHSGLHTRLPRISLLLTLPPSNMNEHFELLFPTEPFTNPSNEVFELPTVRQSPDFEALKLWNVRSGWEGFDSLITPNLSGMVVKTIQGYCLIDQLDNVQQLLTPRKKVLDNFRPPEKKCLTTSDHSVYKLQSRVSNNFRS